MKKLLTVFLVLICVLALIGCNQKPVATPPPADPSADLSLPVRESWSGTVTEVLSGAALAGTETLELEVRGYDPLSFALSETTSYFLHHRESGETVAAARDELYAGAWVEIESERNPASEQRNALSVTVFEGEEKPKDSTAAGEEDLVLEWSPALRVFNHENEVEALRGSTAWYYDQDDGTQIAIAGDSPTPQRMKELMPTLVLMPSTLSHIDPLAVYLQWDVAPDRVRVCSWPNEDFGAPGAKSEEVAVKLPEDDEGIFSVHLSSENRIYEVRAEWDRFENWGGSASYCFYGTVATLRTEAPAE